MIEDRALVLASFCAELGLSISPQRLRARIGELTAPAIAAFLRKQGAAVRCTEPSASSLPQLTLPTLIERRGELCILESMTQGFAFVRAADQRLERVPLAPLAAELSCAFERSAEPAAASFGRALFELLLAQRRALAMLVAVALALAGVAVLTPWLLREAVSQALSERSDALLTTLVAGLIASALLRGWLAWLRARVSLGLEARLLRSVGPFVFKRLLQLPFAQQQEHGIAAQLAVVQSAELAARGSALLLAAPLLELTSLLAALGSLSWVFPQLALVFVGCAPVTLAVSWLLARARARTDAEVSEASGRTRARLHELVRGIATIKAEHAERAVMHRWLDALLRERGLGLQRDLREGWLDVWLASVDRALTFLTVGVCGWSVLRGTASVSDFVFATALCASVLSPLEACGRLVSAALVVRAHCARVDALLPQRAQVAHESARVGHDPGVAIRMSDVWFRHGPERPWILQGHALVVHTGEHVTLRAASGFGKTTILRLLAGFYRAERGTISVAGHDPTLAGERVRYLPQAGQLFAGSLRDNLEQLSGASQARIAEAIERTGIASWLRTLPMGLETVVAAQGANLSGGQRQWLLLTAAVASDEPIVLLDEPLSQMDAVLRAALRCERLFSGRTTITVSHEG